VSGNNPSIETAIEVKNVNKTFRIPKEKSNSVKSLIISGLKGGQYESLHILQNINLEIKHGEFFGIVGRNGSGKSTLLKLLAGIYTPDSGSIMVNGNLTPFIELGVGFNPELTGKENVYLNGALLGMSRREVDSIYHEIVDFAELSDFMDQKLKNYSSGMQVRLAFSIAIQSKSDILLFDEVLAVGDASFQRKCFDKFEQYKAEKKTVILVSHNMGDVRKFCTNALLIADGKIIDYGDPNKIAMHYEDINQKVIDQETANNNLIAKHNDIALELINPHNKSSFSTGDTLKVRLSWNSDFNVKNVGIALMKASGEYVYGKNTFKTKLRNGKSFNSIEYNLKLNFGHGRYYLSAGVFGEKRSDIIAFLAEGPSFIIKSSSDTDWEGLAFTESKWIVNS